MGIKLSSTPIGKIYLGDTELVKAYIGDQQVYSSAPAGPVNYTLTQKSVLEHDTANGTYNSVCKIDDTHFAVAYSSSGDYGYLKTFRVNADLSVAEIDSLEYDAVISTHPSLVKIDDTHLFLAYSGNNFAVTVLTLSIDANYDNITIIDSLVTDTGSNNGNDTSVAMLDSSRFVVAFSGSGSDGYLRTISIDESYNISSIAYLEHDTTSGRYNSLVTLDSTHVALAYSRANAYDGHLKTFYISNDLNTITPIDDIVHNTPTAHHSLLSIDSTHMILAYRDSTDAKGRIITIEIDESYDISVVDTYEFDNTSISYISLCKIDSTHLAVAYYGVDGDGFINTFSIDGSYEIAEIDELEHDTAIGKYNSIIMIDAIHPVLAYAGPDDDGYIKVFEID